eukprot:CAMPEP_0174735110 /NCGR_PEP_ID=MMETSP1094-20130205/64412_1 /TAXON_ID=156173 /ORGANISM="Chrysochromulina brevifilum, Strain UTEX LB 985" /LENGTH=51 /DNA_ID=CAMNT_0015938037 /DNA_START=510 /DNA_END=668 /DNA_ORIENTATION=-
MSRPSSTQVELVPDFLELERPLLPPPSLAPSMYLTLAPAGASHEVFRVAEW